LTLLGSEEVAELIVCPVCKGDLARPDGSRIRCAGCQREYLAIEGYPVLVDFEASVLERGAVFSRAGTSELQRARPSRSRPPWYLQQVEANVMRLLAELQSGARILVVGGGEDVHRLGAVYNEPTLSVVGFDLYVSALTQFIADAHQIPLRDGAFDAVVVQAVLEHVLDPHEVVAEIHRVLRPGGIVYAETAFLQGVHEGAHDFTRFTELGHRWLFRRFTEIDRGAIGGPALQTVWAIDYLARGVFRSRRMGLRSRRLLLGLNGLDRFVPQPYRDDAAPAVFFLGRRSEVELAPRSLVQLYRGAQR
jgi:SAM-dependent methyltransferase